MAASIIRRPRRTQVAVDLALRGRRPLGGVEYSHGRCWLFRGALEDVNRNGGTITSAGFIQTPYGSAISPSSNTGAFTGSMPSTYTLYGWVLHFFLSNSQLDGGDSLVQVANFGAGYVACGPVTSTITGETVTLVFGSARKGIKETLAVDKAHTLAVLWNGSAYEIWLNGRLPTQHLGVDATTLLTTCSQYVSKMRAHSGGPWFNALSAQVITEPIPPSFGRILSLDPYALVRPAYDGSLRYDAGGGGGVNLVIADSAHGHIADNLVLTQAHQLGVDDANHAHTADEIVLQAAAELDINPADHTHSTDILVLTQAHILVLQDSAHAHTADNVVLQSAGTLDIVGGLHAHTADNIDITQAHVLSVADAAHAHAADNVTLDGGAIVVIQDSTHAHAADSLSLAQAHALNIAGALHAHLADNIDVGVDHATLIISDTLHAQLSDQCNVSEQITVIDTPGERIFIIQAEGRVIAVSAGPRAFPIQ